MGKTPISQQAGCPYLSPLSAVDAWLHYEPDFSECRIFRILRSNFGIRGAEHHKRATLTQPSPTSFHVFRDSVHGVTNATVYCLVYILPLGFSNHYPPHLRRVCLVPSPPRPFFTLLARGPVPPPIVTPVAGPIFESKNRAIFLEIFFGRGITTRESCSRAVMLARF